MGTALVDRPQPGDLLTASGCDYRSRVAAAALSCIARFGLSKTTVDDIARQSRLSRATIYRVFPGGREEIVATAARREVDRYFAILGAALAEETELEGLLVTALTKAAEGLARHEALGFVLANEPEVIDSYLAFSGLDRLLGRAGEFLAPFLSGHLPETEARRVGQWVTRLVLSYVGCPRTEHSELTADVLSLSGSRPGESSFALHPEPIGRDLARQLVRNFLLPGIETLRRSTKEAIS